MTQGHDGEGALYTRTRAELKPPLGRSDEKGSHPPIEGTRT